MKTGAKIFLLLVMVALTAIGVYGLTCYYYNIPVLENRDVLLYGSLGIFALALTVGVVIAIAKAPEKKIQSQTAETEEAVLPAEPKQETDVKDAEIALDNDATETGESTDDIPTVSESEEALEKTMVQNIVEEPAEEQETSGDEIPSLQEKPLTPEDITMVMSAEEFRKGEEPKETPVQQARVTDPSLKLDPQITEAQEATSSLWLKADMNPSELSVTQQHYINQSKTSYIDESGLPQFRITQEMPRVTDMSDNVKIGELSEFDDDDYRDDGKDTLGTILNGLMTFLFIVLALLIIFVLFNKFFG